MEDYYCYYGHFETFRCRCGAPNSRRTIEQTDSYRADLCLRLADIRPALLSQEQVLLSVKSSENDAFFDLLYTYAPAGTTGPGNDHLTSLNPMALKQTPTQTDAFTKTAVKTKRASLLVGSLPFASDTEGMTRALDILGPTLFCLPDGEVGEKTPSFPKGNRIDWVVYAIEKLTEAGPDVLIQLEVPPELYAAYKLPGFLMNLALLPINYLLGKINPGAHIGIHLCLGDFHNEVLVRPGSADTRHGY